MGSSLWPTFGQIDFLYPSHTRDYRQYCHVGNTAQHCRWGLFQDSDFAGDLQGFEINIWRSFVFFWFSHVCAHQLDVQKSILQFDTALQNLKLYRWMLVCAWTVHLLLICGTLWLTYCVRHKVMQTPIVTSLRETRAETKDHTQTEANDDQTSWFLEYGSGSCERSTLLMVYPVCTFLKIARQLSRWSITGRRTTMRHVSQDTQSCVWTGCSTESI